MTTSPFLSLSTADAIHHAAEQLKAGHVVAFPTETVYGLGADAMSESAVKRIYDVKGRPTNHPLIVHISSINALDNWAQDVPEYARELARSFWPGPMTIILKRTNLAMDFITGSQDSVGIRVPDHPIALELLKRFELLGGQGVAAPSANRFGHVSPTSAGAVVQEIGDYLKKGELILDGGASNVGIESTIIDCRNTLPIILRPGAITDEMIRSAIDIDLGIIGVLDVRVSGVLEKHYAPMAKVILNQTPTQGQAFMALSSSKTPEGVHRISSPSDTVEFARNLYAAMRMADELGFTELVVHLPEGPGIETALFDRVSKASKGR